MGAGLTGRSLLRNKAGSTKHNTTSEPSAVMATIPGCLAAKIFSLPHGDPKAAISSLSARRACASLT